MPLLGHTKVEKFRGDLSYNLELKLYKVGNGITKKLIGTYTVSVNKNTSNYLLSETFSQITYHSDQLRIGNCRRGSSTSCVCVKCSYKSDAPIAIQHRFPYIKFRIVRLHFQNRHQSLSTVSATLHLDQMSYFLLVN